MATAGERVAGDLRSRHLAGVTYPSQQGNPPFLGLRPFFILIIATMGFPGGSAAKILPAMQEPQETWVRSLGREDPLEEGMAKGNLTEDMPFEYSLTSKRTDCLII